ncbi:hypothetical protein GYH30_046600 [Glycine max]|uniref:Uncharacterized protein n=1 Tax=Glycine max TaxID=3847 RepID=A0A0R0FJ61_SOYBN|nr:hypothetical protein GYH30_046600 [Glycine max]
MVRNCERKGAATEGCWKKQQRESSSLVNCDLRIRTQHTNKASESLLSLSLSLSLSLFVNRVFHQSGTHVRVLINSFLPRSNCRIL